MAGITGTATISDIDLYTVGTVAPGGYHIGDYIAGSNGKGFRLALAGETLVVGDIYQGAVIDTQFDDMAVPANAINSKTVLVTNGTTSVTVNQLDGATLVVSVTPGLGEEYTIIGHDSITKTSGQTLTLVLDRPLRTAWTTSTKVTIRRSPWSGVIKAATTLTAAPAGVALTAATSGQFTWLQVSGVAAILCDASTFAVGSDVGVPGATAGSIGVNVAGTGKCNTVGRALRANASGKCVPVYMVLN